MVIRALLVAAASTIACAHATPASTAGRRMVLYAGGGAGGDGGAATQARLERPFAMARDPVSGAHYIAEFTANRIRKVDGQGVISTVVGPGAPGEAAAAGLNEPHHLAFPPGGGDLFIGDTFNRRLLRVDLRAGSVRPVAAGAGLGLTFNIAFDRKGERLFVTDNKQVRAIELATMKISVFAGDGTQGVPTDGALAAGAPLFDPRAIDVDGHGNVYILERNGHALRVVDPAGRIHTVAGTGQKGDSGDGGDPRQATFNGPKHVAVDLDDNVLVADTENHVVRKILVREHRIERIAGTGRASAAEALPGSPTAISLARPHGVFVDPDGAILIADSWNDRVLRIE